MIGVGVQRSTCNAQPWAIAVALAVGLPWTTWILGWAPDHGTAVRGTPLLLFLCGGLAIVCCWVGERDYWLGLFGGWAVARAAVTLGPPLIEAAMFLVLGLAIVAAAQRIPAAWRPRVEAALAIAGALQVGYAVIQWAGYHPLATGMHPIAWGPDGTLGNRGFLGGYLAITIAFAPAWALAWWLLGLVLSQSVVACVAAAVALTLRCRGRLRLAVLGLVPVMAGVLALRGAATLRFSSLERLEGYRMALQAIAPTSWERLLAVLGGYGPGSWAILAIPMTDAAGSGATGYAIPMHCEPLELLFELGAAGVLLAALWVARHRRSFQRAASGPGGPTARRASGAACGAIAVDALAWFPFHVAPLAALCCVVIGMATGEGDCANVRMRDCAIEPQNPREVSE